MSMNIRALPGTRVRFSGKNGTDGDQEHAQKHLSINGIYTVKRTQIHGFHTDVWLVEFPEEKFNSVLFEEAL